MEKYTVSRELAQKLKDAGYPQKALHGWRTEVGGPSVELANFVHEDNEYAMCAAAPLSDELLEQLPSFIPSEQYEQKAYLWMRKDPTSYCAWYRVNDPNYGEDITSEDGHVGEKFADQLALLWLYCKEHGYLDEPE